MNKAAKKSSRQRMTYRGSARYWKEHHLNMFQRKVVKDLANAEGAARLSQGKLGTPGKGGRKPIRSLVDAAMAAIRRKTGV